MVKTIYTLYAKSNNIEQVDEKSIRPLTAWIKEQMEDAMVKKMVWVPNKEMIMDTSTYREVKTKLILSILANGSLY